MADSSGISSGISRDLSNLDVTKLTPLSPEVIGKQATINIGTIGHVAHGKSTVVKALSGVQTVRFKNELERNITIKLGQKEEGGATQESRVHSTVGVDDDEEVFQVLAEIQSTMASYTADLESLREDTTKSDAEKTLLDSPNRPSVITHTECDSPTKKNLKFEDSFPHLQATSTSNGIPSSPESMDSDKLKPLPPPQPTKRKPGPKSKTRRMDEDDKIEEEKKDSDNESISSSTSSKIITRRKAGAKSPVESDDSADMFEKPVVHTRSKRGKTSTEDEKKLSGNSRRLSLRGSRDNSPDSDASVPVKKKRPSKVVPTSDKVDEQEEEEDLPNGSTESTTDVDNDKKAKSVDKKKNKKVSNDYRVRRKSKRKPKPAQKSPIVSKDTPSETREIQDNGPVDMTVGRQTDGEYEVEIVKSSKKIEGRQYYFVKWRGWPDSFNTWEPMDNLIHSQEALLEFFQTETIRSLERLSELANEIPGLVALTGKFAEYERDVVSTLVKEDFDGMDVNMPEGAAAMLPSYKLLCSHIGKYLKNENKDLQLKIKHLICAREFVRQRFEQMKALEQWERDMFKKTQEKVALTVENLVDLEGPPDNFMFVSDNIPGQGVDIPDDPPVGCECSNCEDDSSCCGVQSGSKFAYTKEGLLKVEHGTPVYECNKQCKCSENCINRVVQNGRTVKLHIFRTPNNIGWGVKILEDVPQGKFICEYMGEVLQREVADERMKNEYKGRPLYIFDLDFNDAKEFPYTVDAYQYGNVSHFINHSCEPNLAVYAVWINCLDPNLPRLAMFAIRDIKAGEELTFDYSAQYHRKRKSQANAKQPQQRPGKTPCRCGSGLCRQVLFETSRAFSQ